MKRLAILLALIVCSVLPVTGVLAFSPLATICSSDSGGAAGSASVCADQSGSNNIYGENGILIKVVDLICVIVGIVAVFMLMIAGFMYVTSGGDSARTNTAKNTLLYAIVGIVIVAIAQIILSFTIRHIGT
jgi:hypothetical protein